MMRGCAEAELRYLERSVVRVIFGALVLVSAAACGATPAEDTEVLADETVQAAAATMHAGEFLEQVRTLSSDEFEGRAPGTRGEDLTVAYLTEHFQRLGLEPGNPDGSYVQMVPLVGYTATPSATVRAGDTTFELEHVAEYVARSRRFDPETRLDASELVFVGYGVEAPEYDWDDYAGADLAGKTLVMLVNDPPVPHPEDPSRLDPDVFRGDAMTYYGRWTYKYEVAAEKGAAAAIIVHETGPAGYPFEVISGSQSGEQFDVAVSGDGSDRLPVEAWVSEPVARRILSAAGRDFDGLKRAARERDFRPVPLGATVDWRVRTATREVLSRNVIAKLSGADPALRDEVVIYTAHWDHLGRDTTLAGDQIYSGALDNASGTAGLLQVARAFTALPRPPARSILFLAVTAEERGLLGAKHYATNPLYPLERTLANINMDGMNQWGRTADIVVVGHGNSDLDDVLAAAAALQGRRVEPDPEPEKGFFYRSDHFEFAKEGVPALYVDAGTDYIDHPEGWGRQKRDEYTATDYHKPSDQVKPDWDVSGAIEDLQLLFHVGVRVAEADRFPEWRPGTEFRAKREEMLGAARAGE